MSNSYTDYDGGGPVFPSNYGYSLVVPATSTIYLDWPFNYQVGIADHFSMPQTTAIQNNIAGAVAILPDATDVATGYIVYFQSIGTQSIIIQDNGLNVLATLATGLSYKFTLVTQATPAGTWSIIQEGAGTSQAQASALAGAGLTTLVSNTALNIQSNIVTLNNNSTLDITFRGKLVVWNGGTGNIILPNPTTQDVGDGWYVDFNNESTTGGVLTISNPAGNIDQNVNNVTLQVGSSGRYVSDGVANYYSFGVGVPTYYNPGLLQFGVNIGTYNLTTLQCGLNIHIFSGTLDGNVIINYTNSVNFFYIFNATSGAFTLSIQNGAAVPIVLTQGLNYIVINIGLLNNGMYTFPSLVQDLDNGPYIIQTPDAFLPNAQALSALATGLVKNTTTTGVLSIATPGTDYFTPSGNTTFVTNTSTDAPANGQVLATLATGLVKNTTSTGILSIGVPNTDYYAPGTTGVIMAYASAPSPGGSQGGYSVDTNGLPAFTSSAIPGTTCNISTNPVFYYQASNTTLYGPITIIAGAGNNGPITPGTTLSNVLINGLPGGHFPNAVVVFETIISVYGNTAGNYSFTAQYYNIDTFGQHNFVGVPATFTYNFIVFPGSSGGSQEYPYQIPIRTTSELAPSVTSTSWGIVYTANGSNPGSMVYSANILNVNAYIIAGGVN